MSKLHLPANPTLADLQQYVREAVAERSLSKDVAEQFMIFLEESGEFAKAARKKIGMQFAKGTRTAELEEEAADVLILLLGLCNLLGIDLEQALRDKEEKNKQRVWK